jgi:phage gp29-like protein
MSNEPVIVSLEALRVLRQNKYNPLRTFTPERLVSILESWEIGNLRDGAMLFETIADRDDTIKSVKPKREKEVSQLDRQFVALPGSGEEGDAHRKILEDFWTNVRTVNAYDRNERGGFRRLVKQMMTSVSYRYAAHHIVWRPAGRTRGSLRATFEFVPLWLFENRTGTLRYLSNPWAQEGDLLDPSEWMITHGDGLMIACSIGYLAKRSAFNDWLVFSEKFSVPGVLGRTRAKKNSPEGIAMRDAVVSFGHDWKGVIYGDDGTHEKPIEIIQAAGNPSGMPMPAVVERVDRKFAALYRGADLSSMSSGQSSEGAGASLQGKEKDILLADDAETINETLAEVSRMVLEWHFGRGVEPLAKVELIVPGDEDDKFYLDSVTRLQKLGVRLSKDAVLDRLGLQEAADGEAALGDSADPEPPTGEETSNAMDNWALSEWIHDFRKALSADVQPLGDAMMTALESLDLDALQAALRKISEQMPDMADQADNLSKVLTNVLVAAISGDDGDEEVENAGNSEGARKGWETRRANGWTSKRAAAAIAKGTDSMRKAIAEQSDVLGAMDVPGLGQVDFRWGTPKGGIRHIVEKHGEADAMQVPSMLFAGELVKGKNRAWVSTDQSYVLLTNNLNGKPTNHWVITGYFRSEEVEGDA